MGSLSTEVSGLPISHGLTLIISSPATFRPLLPYAVENGLRIITMNMRDYRGSTPYRKDELADMTSPDLQAQTLAVRRWGQEISRFLLYVCETMNIPQVAVNGDKKSGGIVLMTWSLSNLGSLAILGDPATLGDEKGKLARYLRRVIFYGML